jgi:hypothetical protein
LEKADKNSYQANRLISSSSPRPLERWLEVMLFN